MLTETVMWADGDEIPDSQNYVEIRQVRLSLRGKGYGVLDYRVQVDFEPEAVTLTAPDRSLTIGSVGMKLILTL